MGAASPGDKEPAERSSPPWAAPCSRKRRRTKGGEECDAVCQDTLAQMAIGPVDTPIPVPDYLRLTFLTEMRNGEQIEFINYETDPWQKERYEKLQTCIWCVALHYPEMLPVPPEVAWPGHEMMQLMWKIAFCWDGRIPRVQGCPYP